MGENQRAVGTQRTAENMMAIGTQRIGVNPRAEVACSHMLTSVRAKGHTRSA